MQAAPDPSKNDAKETTPVSQREEVQAPAAEAPVNSPVAPYPTQGGLRNALEEFEESLNQPSNPDAMLAAANTPAVLQHDAPTPSSSEQRKLNPKRLDLNAMKSPDNDPAKLMAQLFEAAKNDVPKESWAEMSMAHERDEWGTAHACEQEPPQEPTIAEQLGVPDEELDYEETVEEYEVPEPENADEYIPTPHALLPPRPVDKTPATESHSAPRRPATDKTPGASTRPKPCSPSQNWTSSVTPLPVIVAPERPSTEWGALSGGPA